MALELHIAGPGLELGRRLSAGEPALILGRDADCTVCLPDPERNVSRRHLSVWNERDELHFHVLSVVNGVELSGADLPPGSRGVLGVGETLRLSAYQLTVSVLSGDDAQEQNDPWAALETRPLDSQETIPASLADDDPFGDWGFESTFGPGAPGGGLQADALTPATDLRPFLMGLGMDPGRQGALTQGEMETMGRITRIALVGLLQTMQSAAVTRQQVRAEDRPMPGSRETNPLRMDSALETKLYYLFGGRATGAGYLAPDRAVAELVNEVLAHEQAMGEAAREAVQGVLEEFDPETLRVRLLGSGTKLFESARAWDAFVRDYGEQKRHLTQWVQLLLERHFGQAYGREFLRVKRDTTSRRR
jgi:predicted component of type VI protein secretion system